MGKLEAMERANAHVEAPDTIIYLGHVSKHFWTL